jgi:hypothetical protein
MEHDVAIAIGGAVFTASMGIIAYVFRSIQVQFSTQEKRIEQINLMSTMTQEKVQRLEIADARHEERAEDTVRRIEELNSLLHAQGEEMHGIGLTMASISVKLDQLLMERGTSPGKGGMSLLR